jgi:hypothetical protein
MYGLKPAPFRDTDFPRSEEKARGAAGPRKANHGTAVMVTYWDAWVVAPPSIAVPMPV